MASAQEHDVAPALPVLVCLGRAEIRRDAREVLLDGIPQVVRRRVFDLIDYLVRHRPRTVSHAELLSAVWQRSEGSQSLVGRAVMEARRALGDNADDPRYIVSVHGVGYRFAGTLSGLTHDVTSAFTDNSATAEVAALRERIAQARHAVAERRYDDAQLIAEDVLVRADAAGSHAEMARALMVCCHVALNRDRAPDAVRLAQRSLRIAQAEGFGPLVAEARLALGAVHLLAGDPEIAIRQFRTAMEGLSAPGLEGDLRRCLDWLARGLQVQGDVEAALQICRRAIALPLPAGNPTLGPIARINEVQFLAAIGDRELDLGDTPRAQARFNEALTASESLLADLTGSGLDALRVSALGGHAMVLERLDRLEEAWASTQAHEQLARQLSAKGHAPAFATRLDVAMQRARLLARLGRMDEALAVARATMAEAEAVGQPVWTVGYWAQAADVAARAGMSEQALQWQRYHSQAQARLHASKAASLAAVLAAELNADELQAELERLRAQNIQLVTENAQLRRRLQHAETGVPVLAHTGLATAGSVGTVFGAAFEQAQSRHLPMCIVVLTLENASVLIQRHTLAVLATLWRSVAAVLADTNDVHYPAVELDKGSLAFHVRNAGQARAQAVAEEVSARLQRQLRTDVPLAEPPRWRYTVCDAASYGSIDDWLSSATSCLGG